MSQLDLSAPVNITKIMKSVDIITKVVGELSATSRWTQDYSWLYNYNWDKLMEIFTNYDVTNMDQM